LRIEKIARLEHRMHDHRQFAGHDNGGSFEADPFAPPEANALLQFRSNVKDDR